MLTAIWYLLLSFQYILSIPSPLPSHLRSDCGYVGISPQQCVANGCEYIATDIPDMPWCFHKMPVCNGGYNVLGETPKTAWTTLEQSSTVIRLQISTKCQAWSEDVPNLVALVTLGKTSARVQIHDEAGKKFKVQNRKQSLIPLHK
jgi:hypothetical protein